MIPCVLHVPYVFRPFAHKLLVCLVALLITAEVIQFLELTVRVISIFFVVTASDKVKQYIYTCLRASVVIAYEIPEVIILEFSLHFVPFHR